jgi:hypothetical protein
MAQEEPKRLTPKPETLRELYLKSGNQCAFGTCNELIINNEGTLIGEVCHIEAALPGGERFNEDQSNEDRRAFENLILLCRNHHAITNNVDEFSVESMIEMKATHEAKYSSIEEKMIKGIEDMTKLVKPIDHSGLNRLAKVLEWNLEPEELAVNATEVDEFIQTLKRVPINTRRVYTIMIERHSMYGSDMVINPEELEEVTHSNANEIKKHINILYRYDLATKWYSNFDGEPEITIKDTTGWNFVADLWSFCRSEEIELSRILVDLDFSVLD